MKCLIVLGSVPLHWSQSEKVEIDKSLLMPDIEKRNSVSLHSKSQGESGNVVSDFDPKWGEALTKRTIPQIGTIHLTSTSPSGCVSTLFNCSIKMVNGQIITNNPQLRVEIKNFMMSVRLFPSELQNLKFFGIVEVRQGPCDCTLKGDDFCTRDHVAYHIMSEECSASGDSIFPGIIASLVLMIIFTYLLIRYLWVKVFYAPKGWKRVLVTGGYFDQEIQYAKKFKTNIFSFARNQNTAQLHREDRTAKQKFNVKCLILAMLLFKYPVINESLGMELHSQTITVSEGQYLKTSLGTIIVDQAHEIMPLQHVYRTASWESSFWSEWYCIGYKCDLWGKCETFSPHGMFSSFELNINQSNPRKGGFDINYCQTGYFSCFGNNGCQRWSISIDVNMDDYYDVYKIGQSQQVLSIRHSGNTTLAITSAAITDRVSLHDMSILRSPTGKYWVCPMSENKYKAEFGLLGDLQYNSGNVFTFPNYDIDCKFDMFNPPICSVPISFILAFESVCKPMPYQVGSHVLTVENGMLKANKLDNVDITVLSGVDLEVYGLQENCAIRMKEAWVTDSGAFPSYVAIRLELGGPHSRKEVTMPCGMKAVSIPCDGEIHKFEVTASPDCDLEKSGFNITTLTESQMSFYRDNVLTNTLANSEYRTMSDYLSHPGLFWLTGISGSLFSFLIILLILMLCLRR